MKVDVYTFKDRKVQVLPTWRRFKLPEKQQRYVEKVWAENSKPGWRRGFIPLAERLKYTSDQAVVSAGVMDYGQVYGILHAIDNREDFAPESIPNLSVGIIPVTSDQYVFFSRRDTSLANAGGVWNFPGGYMNSLLIDKEKGEEEKSLKDPRLFDIMEQARLRMLKQEFDGLSEEDIQLEGPFSLAFGTMHSREMEFGLIARIKKSKGELSKYIRDYRVAGVKEHISHTFLGLEDLNALLANQPGLLGINPKTYKTRDPRRIILLDDNLGELIGGGLHGLVGIDPSPQLLRELGKHGLRINVKSSDLGKEYTFS